MTKTPINIKINYTNGKQNFITFPARFGNITTTGFIYSDSLKRIYKTANKYAVEIAKRLNVNVDPNCLIQCLEAGITAFILRQWGYIQEMQMSKEFVVFYNMAACALLDEDEYVEQEISFYGDGEFMKLVG